jgi:hypothetical protein
MTARTIVGSGPRRRPLPLGREAVERALRLCKFWPFTGCPFDASCRAFEARACKPSSPFMQDVTAASWLPSDLRRLTPEQLRERLRGYP